MSAAGVAALPQGAAQGLHPVIDEALRAARTVAHVLSRKGGLAYAEGVLTLPASVGATVPPAEIEAVRGELVCALEDGGARRGKAILLVNPAEITPTFSVLTLGRSPGRLGQVVGEVQNALQGNAFCVRPDGVLGQVLSAQAAAAASVLLPSGHSAEHRLDVTLAATSGGGAG